MTHVYFRREGGLCIPDRSARGPWNSEHQSGLAIVGLLARAIEHTHSVVPMRVARLTVDFLGAVLMKPTEVRAEILRDGKRMQVVAASLWVDGAMAASATGLRVCEGEGPNAPTDAHGFPTPEDAPRVPVTPYFDAGHPLETRVVQKANLDGAPGAFWSRFNTTFMEGEGTSPVIRACMAADIAAGAATTAATRGWRFPNADLSLYFAREPKGDWLLAVANMDIANEGVALMRSMLADETGSFGYARQTLVLSRQKPVE